MAMAQTKWTNDEVDQLFDAIREGDAKGKPRKDTFESVADQLGRSVGTVQQKFYNKVKATKAEGITTRKRRGRPSNQAKRAVVKTIGLDAMIRERDALQTKLDRMNKDIETQLRAAKEEIDRQLAMFVK